MALRTRAIIFGLAPGGVAQASRLPRLRDGHPACDLFREWDAPATAGETPALRPWPIRGGAPATSSNRQGPRRFGRKVQQFPFRDALGGRTRALSRGRKERRGANRSCSAPTTRL